MDKLDESIKEFLRQNSSKNKEAHSETVPPELIRKAKDLFEKKRDAISCPHCGKAITPFKQPVGKQIWKNSLWLVLSMSAFSLSFVYGRYFLQCLVLALFFGVKWIVVSKVTKTQIMIYKAMSEGDVESSGSHSNRLKHFSKH